MKYGRKMAGLLLIPVVIVSMIGVSFVSAEAKGKPFGGLWDAIFGLRTRVDNHDAEIAELRSKIAALEAAIETLEGQLETHTHDYSEITSTPDIAALALTREPDYDSGWVFIERGSLKFFEHGLGLNVMVSVYGRVIIHGEEVHTIQDGYGGDMFYVEEEGGTYEERGFYWENEGGHLAVFRNQDEWGIAQFRVQIWKLD